MRIMNEKSYQKLAFVFAHDIKTFEGYIKLSGVRFCIGLAGRSHNEYLCVNFSYQVIPGNLQMHVPTNHSLLQCKTLLAHFKY